MAEDAKAKAIAHAEVAAASPEVYRMFSNSTAVREWLADAALISPREGGRVYLAWNDGRQVSGSITSIDQRAGMTISWQIPDQDPTKVRVSWTPTSTGSAIEIRHTGFPKGKKGQKAAGLAADFWQRGLENLASVLSTGEDLRFTRRPMLGVFVDSEVRGDGGEPVGVRLGGVVEGMGAETAGLIAGDVVTSLGGRPTHTFTDLGTAAGLHRAGDTVPVGFIRGGEASTTEMTLSGRPIGDVRTTASALSSQIEEISSRFLDQLESVLDGVEESKTNLSPAEGEWSVKEVLAHLIDSEGDLHGFLVEAFEGAERYHDVGFNNSHWRTAATAASYPDSASMLAAYRRLVSQTVNLIASMPADFERRKATMWRFAYGFSEMESHLTEHLQQIKSAIDQGS